jgi:phosphoribosylformimino-5-aminoimidazole carboxamide ribonucleotide (ProFAR) isomerase
VHTLNDVKAAHEANLSGVVVGRALYEGTIDIKDCLQLSA